MWLKFSSQIEAGLGKNAPNSSIYEETTGLIWIVVNVVCMQLPKLTLVVHWSATLQNENQHSRQRSVLEPFFLMWQFSMSEHSKLIGSTCYLKQYIPRSCSVKLFYFTWLSGSLRQYMCFELSRVVCKCKVLLGVVFLATKALGVEWELTTLVNSLIGTCYWSGIGRIH